MSIRQPTLFNQSDRFAEGWYWAIAATQLRRGQVKAVTVQGRDLVVYRGDDGQPVALDAYCPHMGAHLAEGRVDGTGLRCFFHNWKFEATGQCVDSPALDAPAPACVQRWPAVEQYGLIWVWTGKTAKTPAPYVPELEQVACDAALGRSFTRPCHPNVVMINAIDAHHFNTVHHLPLDVVFESAPRSPHAIAFHNTTRGGEESWFIRLIRPFYREAVTYSMCYWFGSTGIVTVGPDFLHFYIMFALRLGQGGATDGQTVLITPRRRGIGGWFTNRILLWLTARVGNYFARGDTQVFNTIKFNFQTPTAADTSIIQFIHHFDQQPALSFKTWQQLDAIAQPDSLKPTLPATPEREAKSMTVDR